MMDYFQRGMSIRLNRKHFQRCKVCNSKANSQICPEKELIQCLCMSLPAHLTTKILSKIRANYAKLHKSKFLTLIIWDKIVHKNMLRYAVFPNP